MTAAEASSVRTVSSLALFVALAAPAFAVDAALEPSGCSSSWHWEADLTHADGHVEGPWSYDAREECRTGNRAAVAHEGDEVARVEVFPAESERSWEESGTLSGDGCDDPAIDPEWTCATGTWTGTGAHAGAESTDMLRVSAAGHAASAALHACERETRSTYEMEGGYDGSAWTESYAGNWTATETCEQKAEVDGHGARRTCTRETEGADRSTYRMEDDTHDFYGTWSTESSTTSRCERTVAAAGERVVLDRCAGTSSSRTTGVADDGPGTWQTTGSSEETCWTGIDEGRSVLGTDAAVVAGATTRCVDGCTGADALSVTAGAGGDRHEVVVLP